LITQVEARERKVAAVEEEMKQHMAQKTIEVQALQRRLREDSKHQVELERQKAAALQERIAR